MRQAIDELGDGGVVVGQLLIDRARRLERLQRLGRLAGVVEHVGDAVVAVRQLALEPGDGRVVVGQLLEERRAARTIAAPSVRLPVTRSTKPMLP